MLACSDGRTRTTLRAMMANPIRRAAVAGSWYLASADEGPPGLASLTAVIAPHAGLRYSGPGAAYAYRQLRHRSVDVAVLVGPSHFVGFGGVSICRTAGFDTPLGVAQIDDECASAIAEAPPIVREHLAAHVREHSIEM